MSLFNDKVAKLLAGHEALLMRKNEPVEEGNGVITRYRYPVLTAAHTPVFWRYDLNEETNPFLMERIGMNATLNAGAIKWDGKYLMLVRVEGADRKSFFAVAESPASNLATLSLNRLIMDSVFIVIYLIFYL